MPRKLKNIRWRRGKPQAYTEVGGKARYKTFPRSTPAKVIREWVDRTAKQHPRIVSLDGSFAADIEAYLKRIVAMPTYKQKKAHLELWAQALGRDRPRRTITPGEIDGVMQLWLKTPSTPKRGRPSGPNGLDPQTVRKRRTNLNSLWVKLDGKAAENPVRATGNPKPPKAEVRGTDYGTIERILDAMPVYRDTLKGTPKKLNASRIRSGVLAYTGLPPGILGTLTKADVNLKAATMHVEHRLKGGGVEARTLPLTAQAVVWFRLFDAADLYGTYSPEALNVAFKRACRRIGIFGLTIYDLRHSFGAEMYRLTKDRATVARLMLHAENSTQTARYSKAADAEVDRAAVTAFGQKHRTKKRTDPVR